MGELFLFSGSWAANFNNNLVVAIDHSSIFGTVYFLIYAASAFFSASFHWKRQREPSFHVAKVSGGQEIAFRSIWAWQVSPFWLMRRWSARRCCCICIYWMKPSFTSFAHFLHVFICTALHVIAAPLIHTPSTIRSTSTMTTAWR